MRFNYTSYDMRKSQDSINIRRHPDCIILADERTAQEQGHPYLYGRIIGIFHVYVRNTTRFSTDFQEQRMDVLWVRWYQYDEDFHWGWERKRLPRVYFPPATDPDAFGFVDPRDVIRGAHLIPVFDSGVTDSSLPEDSVARVFEELNDEDFTLEEEDWGSYNVNM
jgi:hypothetical protein